MRNKTKISVKINIKKLKDITAFVRISTLGKNSFTVHFVGGFESVKPETNVNQGVFSLLILICLKQITSLWI